MWLEDLQRAKVSLSKPSSMSTACYEHSRGVTPVFQAEAVKGQRVKITISDIVDRANGVSLACTTAYSHGKL